MLMSSRVKAIIRILVEERRYVTVKEIADKIKISERTVYRSFQEITEILQPYDLKLETASKKGVRIAGKDRDRHKIVKYLDEGVSTQIIEPKNRSQWILFELIHQEEPLKTEALAIDLRTSVPTVRNDLKKIQQQCEQYELQLIQKKGQGVYLKGSQKDKDRLLVNIIREVIDVEKILLWMDGNQESFHPFLIAMEEEGIADQIRNCHQCLHNISVDLEEYGYYMEDGTYVEFVLLTALMLRRKEKVQIEEPAQEHETEKQITQRVKDKLQKEFKIQINADKTKELYQILHMSIAAKTIKQWSAQNYELKNKVREFVCLVEDQMGICLVQDQKLMEGLVVHIEKALKRIRSNMCISNPMVKEIQKEYEQLFQMIEKSITTVFPEDYFPEDEIGYLVLYFAVSLDNIAKKTFRVLVVCSSGMGSSKMLASRLEREIPEICVRKIVSLIGLGKEDLNQYDLILSTIPLYLDQDIYLKVSPLLNPKELEIVKEKIRRHKHKTLRKIEKEDRDENFYRTKNGVASLTRLHNVIEEMLRILKDFKVIRCETKEAGENLKEEILKKPQENRDDIKDAFFMIPTTKVGYYEYVSKTVRSIILNIYYFEKEEIADKNFKEKMKSMVTLIYPEEMNESEKEIIHFITSQIIEDTSLLHLIELGDETAVRQRLSLQYMEHLREHM